MATAMTPAQWRATLKAEGVSFTEHAGWETHNRAGHGAWGDVHMVLIHHTAGKGPSDGSVVWSGRADLPGPCAHAYLPKSGVVQMMSSGRANHAGKMARNAYTSFLGESSTHPKPSASSGTLDGNAVAYGLEISNLGDGHDPYLAVQYEAAVRWAAAICRHHGWSANSVGGHKETSIEGKVDPSFDMTQFRRDVAARLGAKPSGSTSAPASGSSSSSEPTVDLSNVIAAARTDPRAAQGHVTHPTDVRVVERALQAEGLLSSRYAVDGSFGSLTVEAYRSWQRRCGYSGHDADGIPGLASLTKLGKKHGFQVKG